MFLKNYQVCNSFSILLIGSIYFIASINGEITNLKSEENIMLN